MGMLDGLWHLLNFLAPAVVVGTLSALVTKALWRGELRSVSAGRLVAWAVGASAGVLVVGLFITGRDGRMATYGAMVAACAVTLWWLAFGPRRK